MHRRTGKRMGLALMLAALCLRLLVASGLEAAAKAVKAEWQDPAFRRLVLAMGTGSWPESEPEEQSRLWVVKKAQKPPAAGKTPAVPPLTGLEAEGITIGGLGKFSGDKTALLLQETPITGENPTVLLIHTHTSESYSVTAGWQYDATDSFRTADDDHSVVRVGQEVAKVLEARGISVLHHREYHDYPDYSGSYTRTKSCIESLLTQYPSIQVVVDLHRDALTDAKGAPLHRTVTLADGTPAALLMLVVGTDQGGASHPAWQENLSWALKVQALLGRRQGDICRNLDLRTERFNQHLTPKSMLVEVGATGNTMPEALAAARVFAEALADAVELSLAHS